MNRVEKEEIKKITNILQFIESSKIRYNEHNLKKYVNKKLKPTDLVIKVLINKVYSLKREGKGGKGGGQDFLLYKNHIFPLMGVKGFLYLKKHINTKDPYFKGKIIEILSKFEYKETLLILEQFLNDRTICRKITPILIGKPLRICDVTYNAMSIILLRKDLFNKKLKYSLGTPDNYTQNDKEIQKFKIWWEKNKERILKYYRSYKEEIKPKKK